MAIPYSTQTIGKKDIDSITQVLRSSWLTTGPWVERFEQKVATFVGARYAVAVANGTAALHTACFGVGVTAGDEVITTPYSFAATANCVLYCGGTVVFADVDQTSLTINPTEVEKKVTKKTKAIIGVDFAGMPADWLKLQLIAQKHKLKLVADAAHSLGASYLGKAIGSLADVTCFSFHPVKTITTGEGGMVVTNSKAIYERMKRFRTHGIVKGLRKTEPWYYEMRDLGFNYRLTDMQSALGLSQLSRVKSFVNARKRLAQRYTRVFAGLKHLLLPSGDTDEKQSSWHLYPLRIDFDLLKKSKRQLFAQAKRAGITLQVHYLPIHLHPYYRKTLGFKPGDFPLSVETYNQEVSLPLYPTLTYRQQDRVIRFIRHFVKRK